MVTIAMCRNTSLPSSSCHIRGRRCQESIISHTRSFQKSIPASISSDMTHHNFWHAGVERLCDTVSKSRTHRSAKVEQRRCSIFDTVIPRSKNREFSPHPVPVSGMGHGFDQKAREEWTNKVKVKERTQKGLRNSKAEYSRMPAANPNAAIGCFITPLEETLNPKPEGAFAPYRKVDVRRIPRRGLDERRGLVCGFIIQTGKALRGLSRPLLRAVTPFCQSL